MPPVLERTGSVALGQGWAVESTTRSVLSCPLVLPALVDPDTRVPGASFLVL